MTPMDSTHFADGDLLRLLDGDGAPGELEPLRRHADACAACARALATLRREAAVVSAGLSELVPAAAGGPAVRMRPAYRPRVPAYRRMHPALRAAAVLVAVAVPLAMVTPVRAALARWIETGFGLRHEAPVAAAAPAAAGAPDAAAALVWFAPGGPELTVQLHAPQAAGVLRIERVDGDRASLQITGDDAGLGALASARGLEIPNRPESRASYQLRVPASVQVVRVLVDGGPPRRIGAAQLPRTLELKP